MFFYFLITLRWIYVIFSCWISKWMKFHPTNNFNPSVGSCNDHTSKGQRESACLALSLTLIKFHGGRLKTAYYGRVMLGILGFVRAPEALWASTSKEPPGDVLSLSSCDIGGWKDATDRGCLLMKSRLDIPTQGHGVWEAVTRLLLCRYHQVTPRKLLIP